MIKRLMYFICALAITFVFSCKKNRDSTNYSLDGFESIDIAYATGDEVIKSYAMKIYDSAGILKTKFTSPLSDVSLFKRHEVTKTLSEEDIKIISDFIEKAKKQNDTCSFLSSSLDRYHIKIGTLDSISILGNCNWDGLDYITLTQRIYD